MTQLTALEIANLVDGDLKGDPDIVIERVASLDIAEPEAISFLSNPKYAKYVVSSKAGVILLPTDFEGEPPQHTAWIQVEDPNAAFTTVIMQLVHPPTPPAPGIDASAIIAPDADLGNDVHVGPGAVVGAGTMIGDRTIVEAGCVIGPNCTIGLDCRFYSNVSVRDGSVIGNRVIVHCNAVIGSDGFGYEPDLQGHHKIPQLGIVQIDDDVEIGAGTAIDRARFGKTWIQQDVKIDNLCHIAHNVVIGKGSFIMAQVGLAGSATLGNYVAMFGKSGSPGHIKIGDFSKIMGLTVPIDDVPEHSELVGYPATERKQYFRQYAAVKRLPEALKTIKTLEKRISDLEERLKND